MVQKTINKFFLRFNFTDVYIFAINYIYEYGVSSQLEMRNILKLGL